MNSLLKRQIRKYLSQELKSNKDLEQFFDAIDRSYNNFDDQFTMQQRAMNISSEELFEANQLLKKEGLSQQEVINKLKRVINTLKFYDLSENEVISAIELDGLKLAEYIDNHTKKIIEINKQREKLLSELAYQNQELNDYAHMVSHDLKSPLRSIDTLVSWITKDYSKVLDANGNEQLKLIRNNVEKMDILINSILEYSTIGKNQIEVYKVDLNNLILELLNSMHIPKHFKIIKNNLPVVKGNKHRLKQLFQNIIDNGVKYNDKKRGVIEIDCEDKNDFWQFSIKDNGIGIEKKYYDKIFKIFNSLNKRENSTGIGLSIVKKIITFYDGEIWIDSVVGKYTTFYFTLKK